MILKLRRRHRRVMLTLVIALPAALAVAIVNRKPTVVSEAHPLLPPNPSRSAPAGNP